LIGCTSENDEIDWNRKDVDSHFLSRSRGFAGGRDNEAAGTAIEGRAMMLKKRMVTVRMGRCEEMSRLGTKGKSGVD
jgi:hypothetical protein